MILIFHNLCIFLLDVMVKILNLACLLYNPNNRQKVDKLKLLESINQDIEIFCFQSYFNAGNSDDVLERYGLSSERMFEVVCCDRK